MTRAEGLQLEADPARRHGRGELRVREQHGGPRTTDETLRRQEYWTMLSGATGQLYGNGYTWG